MILLHQILGKCLGALEDRRIFARTEYPKPFRLEDIHDTADERIVHAYDRQVDLVLLRKSCKPVKLHCLDIDTLRILCNTRIARCTVNLLCLRRSAQSSTRSHALFRHFPQSKFSSHVRLSPGDRRSAFVLCLCNLYLSVFYCHPAICDQVDCLRENHPFGFLHHTQLQLLCRIVLLYLDCLL